MRSKINRSPWDILSNAPWQTRTKFLSNFCSYQKHKKCSSNQIHSGLRFEVVYIVLIMTYKAQFLTLAYLISFTSLVT